MSQSLPDQLRATVRFMGRVLGDVIRAQDGQAVFDQIEEIRQASVAFHREGTPEAAARMAERLAGLSLSDTVRFVHSFACFLQITNIAEDQIDRRRGRSGDARPDTLAGALRTLRAEGTGQDAVAELLRGGLIAPVITAHPSEVRRKSVLDRQGAIADELDAFDQAASEPSREAIERELNRQVSILAYAAAEIGEARGGRRDRERRLVLRAELPGRSAGLVRPLARRAGRRGRAAQLPAGGLLGRRRPGRQSLCHG